MKESDYRNEIVSKFSEQIRKKKYDWDFKHPEASTRYFLKTISEELGDRWTSDSHLDVLDCGMGSGSWLWELASSRETGSLGVAGFDLTPEFAELAQKQFTLRSKPGLTVHFLKAGDITDLNAYRKDEASSQKFDVVFTYDVLQQLPMPLRSKALDAMLGSLAPGGRLFIFDKHRYSKNGIRMAFKKWMTRYTPFSMVPKHYLLASYPDMFALAKTLRRQGFGARVIWNTDKVRYVLIVEKR